MQGSHDGGSARRKSRGRSLLRYYQPVLRWMVLGADIIALQKWVKVWYDMSRRGRKSSAFSTVHGGEY